MASLPVSLVAALKPITVICGHYGTGKTTFTCNLASGLAAVGKTPTVVDLDLVNPYFRVSEQRVELEAAGVRLVAPVFAEAGSSLDVPSLRGSVAPAISGASEQSPTLLDVGGDDAGTVALGRFRATIAEGQHVFLGVVNAYRNLVADPSEAVENLREIEAASGFKVNYLVDNSHLGVETSGANIEDGYAYALEVSRLMGVPLAAVTVPAGVQPPAAIPPELVYPVDVLPMI